MDIVLLGTHQNKIYFLFYGSIISFEMHPDENGEIPYLINDVVLIFKQTPDGVVFDRVEPA